VTETATEVAEFLFFNPVSAVFVAVAGVLNQRQSINSTVLHRFPASDRIDGGGATAAIYYRDMQFIKRQKLGKIDRLRSISYRAYLARSFDATNTCTSLASGTATKPELYRLSGILTQESGLPNAVFAVGLENVTMAEPLGPLDSNWPRLPFPAIPFTRNQARLQGTPLAARPRRSVDDLPRQPLGTGGGVSPADREAADRR
jgi:hypothetical protein